MNIPSLPDRRAAADPVAPCLADDAVALTNAEFVDAVQAAAAVLRDRGVGGGDVVAVMLPNTVDLVVTLFAAWRLGAAVTPLNPALSADEAAYQVADAGARVLVAGDNATAGPIPVVTPADLKAGRGPVEIAPSTEQSLALLIYTSGTTGRPKGVMLDHANLNAMCASVIEAYELTAADNSLLILPLFHVNGIVVGTLSPLIAGGHVTIAGRFEPRGFFDRVKRCRPTFFSAVPTIYTMLVGLPEDPAVDTSSLRFAVCGAAPAGAELLERFEKRYGVPIVEGYGLSEGTCASAANPLRGRRKPGTVGVPLPGQQIRIADAAGNTLDANEIGEVLIAGPTVMRGYLNRPEETAKTVVEGWLHTGDLGYLDEDGYLVLVDRAKDMIIRGGENIYPKEIETVAYRLPEIAEVAVVGRPHPLYGEVPVMFLASAPGHSVDTDAVRRHLQESLAKYKQPMAITVLDSLPKNAVGKIDKPAIRKHDSATAAHNGLNPRRKDTTRHELHTTRLSRRRTAGVPAQAPARTDPYPQHQLGGTRIRHTADGLGALHREGDVPLRTRRSGHRHRHLWTTGFLACVPMVEPADRLPETDLVDGAPGGHRTGRVLGSAGWQDQADDRWHPVLDATRNHPTAPLVMGSVHLR